MAGFIEDGYDRDDGFIAPALPNSAGVRLHDGLSFSYRTASRQEVVKHDAECRIALANEDRDPQCAVDAEKLACKFIASRLAKWDLTNSKKEVVPITPENLGRIIPALFGPLYRIIRGVQVSDPKPTEKESPPSDEQLAKN